MKLSLKTPEWALPLIGNYRYKGARGGRGSGKSHFFAQEIVAACVVDPNVSVVCIREIQKSIRLSSKRLIEAKINQLGVSHLFHVTQQEIQRKGGDGLIVFQGMQDHTADSIKSLEGFKVAWVEEAQNISERSLRLLRPTMRSGSQLWFSWNPEFEEDPVEQLFSLDDEQVRCITVNWNDNPFFPEELRGEMERDRKLYSPQMFAHVWEGAYITGDMGEVFKWNWFREHEFIGNGHYDYIVHSWDTAYKADQHNDPSACTVWGVKGKNAYLIHVLNERMEYPALKQRVIQIAKEYPPSHILVEDKSSGQSLIQELRAHTSLPVIPVKLEAGKDKVARASACTGTIEAGRIFVPKNAEWLSEYRKQLTRFSFDKEIQKQQHDDMVDSTSQFINWWSGRDNSQEFFNTLARYV